MSRPLRIEYPGALYHITSRGNARQEIFLNDKDFRKFLDYLGKEIDQQNWKCYAYCLMNNHYHLLIETPEANLVKGMTRLNGSYTQYFNFSHNRVGHLFQGRYKSIIVDKESYLLELCRYIVLNPVRAGIVKTAYHWKWSSYRKTAGIDNKPEWLDSKFILEQFSSKRNKATGEYRRFVKEGIEGETPWKELKGQIWLGSDVFIRRIENILEKDESKGIPSAQKDPLRPDKNEVIKGVAEIYGLTETDLTKRRNKEAYRIAAYILRRRCNIGIGEVASVFGISEGMVSKVQREIEGGVKLTSKAKKLLKKYKVQT